MTRRSLRRDQGGQMMLLAAFIFVIGLLAMSATLARVPLLAKQVAREQDRPLVGHIDPMLEGFNEGLAALSTDHGLAPGSAKFEEAVRGSLAHARAVEASHGFFMEWTIVCDLAGPANTARAHIEITDGALWIEARTDGFELPAATCP